MIKSMIYLLFLILLCVVYLSYKVFENDILCPSFLFSLSLSFGCFWAVLYSKKWDLGLHLNTLIVIGFGSFVFFVSAFIIHFIYLKMHKAIGIRQNYLYAMMKNKTIVDLMCLLFSIFVVLWTAKVLTDWAGLPMSEIIAAGRKYDNLKFDSIKSFSFPSMLSLFRLIIDSMGFFFSYKVANELVLQKKVNVVGTLIVIFSMLNSMITGGRTGAVNIILGMIFYLLFALQNKAKSNKILNFKLLMIIVSFVFLILVSFPYIGILMKRSIGKNPMDYMAMYIGAEIKNLDIFLQRRWKSNTIWGSQTFIELVHSFGRRLGVANPYYNLDLPFQSVNGYNLGNVYTVFYPFIYDFGYLGWFIITIVMAALSQVIYDVAKHSVRKEISLIFTLIYGTMFNTLLFAFFSNKFFEINFTVAFFKKIIVLIILAIIEYNTFTIKELRYKIKQEGINI